MIGSELPVRSAFQPKSLSGKAFRAEIDSIPIAPHVRRTRERLPSNGFIESAPEHRAHAHSFSNARFR